MQRPADLRKEGDRLSEDTNAGSSAPRIEVNRAEARRGAEGI
jgi:hypothetical protein